MQNKQLITSLVAVLGLSGAAQAANAPSDGGMTAVEQQIPHASPASGLNIASEPSKGADASCKTKGSEASCKSKGSEASCKSHDAKKISYVGGAAMYPTKDIIDNAVNSPEHTTLVAAVKAAGLVDTLKGAGPFTVFAPTDKAFKELPAGTVDSLLKPENKDALTKVLTYHVVPGNLDAAALKKQIKDGGGSAILKTVQGEELHAKLKGGKIELTDSKGGTAKVSQGNVFQSNGVIHVVDKVLMP